MGHGDHSPAGFDFPQDAERGCDASGKEARRVRLGQPAPLGQHEDSELRAPRTHQPGSGGPASSSAEPAPPAVVMDYPAAWAYVREQHPDPAEHDPRCSWVIANGAVLCDCHVLDDEYERRKASQ